jgi:hypothetical protein
VKKVEHLAVAARELGLVGVALCLQPLLQLCRLLANCVSICTFVSVKQVNSLDACSRC